MTQAKSKRVSNWVNERLGTVVKPGDTTTLDADQLEAIDPSEWDIKGAATTAPSDGPADDMQVETRPAKRKRSRKG